MTRDEAQSQLEDQRSRWENDNWMRPNARTWERWYVETVLQFEHEPFTKKLSDAGLTFDEFFVRSRVDPESLLDLEL